MQWIGKTTASWITGQDHDAAGVMTGDEHEATGWIERNVASGFTTMRRELRASELARRCVHVEFGDSLGAAISDVDKSSVRRSDDLRRGRCPSGVAVGLCRNGRSVVRQRTFFAVPDQVVDGRVEFVDVIDQRLFRWKIRWRRPDLKRPCQNACLPGVKIPFEGAMR